jgi:hypothetical protein
MKINGLNVDTETIGAGVYQIICERGEEAIVAFGMIPKWAMDLTEKEVREKIIAEAVRQQRCDSAEEERAFREHVSEELLRATVNPIMREIGSAIYTAASKAGKMIV